MNTDNGWSIFAYGFSILCKLEKRTQKCTAPKSYQTGFAGKYVVNE